MNSGMTLVELMISLTISSLLILSLYSMYSLFSVNYLDTRGSWYCMQSLRNSVIQIDADIRQCACLLPQDLKVACAKNSLFISGPSITSGYSGLELHAKAPPPYYSVVRTSSGKGITIDTVDIDGNDTPDYRADLGIISDSGPSVISHGYSMGNLTIPLTSPIVAKEGDRLVPSVHYELRGDGLYRNSQLLAEAIRAFDARVVGHEITIDLTASHNNEKKTLSCTYHIF